MARVVGGALTCEEEARWRAPASARGRRRKEGGTVGAGDGGSLEVAIVVFGSGETMSGEG